MQTRVKRVLLIDDTQEVLMVTQMILESLGVEVVATESGRIALEIFGDGSGFDLVLTDWEMPEMDGLRLAKEIKDRNPGTKVVVTSGRALLIPQDALEAVGVTEALQKPFLPGVLETLLGIQDQVV